MHSYRKSIDQLAKRQKSTIRQMYKLIVPSAGHVVIKGNAQHVADQLEDWYRTKAADGFNIGMPVQPRSLETFIDLVIPELQRRKLFRTEYPGGTLRNMLGLPTPQRQINPNGAWQFTKAHEPGRREP